MNSKPHKKVRSAKRTRTARPAEVRAREGQNTRIFGICCLALGMLTIAIYARIAWHPFVNFDDGPYVFENSHVSGGLSLATVKWAFATMAAGNWHPITWLSHALDCQLFGLNPGGHHLTSLLLHVLNSALLFLLLERATGARWRSLAVAALFALHPLNVESVAWIAERKNLLCTFFFLLALGAYGWYARQPSIKRYLCMTAFFVLGLASKPMVITLPFVLLLLDYWPLGRIEKWSTPSATFPVAQAELSRLVLEKIPLLVLSISSGVITFIAQRGAGAVARVAGWPLSWRIGNAIHSYAMYFYMALLPNGLAPFYPATALHMFQILWAAALLLGVSWLVWKFREGRPYLMMGWLWFLGTLVPVIGLIQVGSQAMADRYMYIPLLGIVVALVWCAQDFLRLKTGSAFWGSAAVGVAIIALSLGIWRQVGHWRSSYDLWTYALQVTKSNFVAEENLGVSLLDLGREDEAFPHFERVTAIQPDDAVALLNAGNYLERQGRHEDAIQKFQHVLRVSHDSEKLTGAYRGLGVAYAQLGDRANARASFLHALQLSPDNPTELYNLSLLEIRDGIDNLTRTVSVKPTPEGYLQLGQLLREDQRTGDAQLAFEKALRLNPSLSAARQALRDLKQSNQ